MQDLSDDTTPQLGGNLDTNGHNIDSVTPTELGYVHGVTSAIQTQIDGKEAADSTILKEADVDDSPVNGVTTAPISSNWAYDHAANSGAHHGADDLTLGSILTGDGTYNGTTISVTVDDASAAFGTPLYCASDFHYERTDANSTSTMPCVGIALESGTGTKLMLLEGQICHTAWSWSAGDVYVSGTTGELTQTAPSASGDQVQRVGFALSADTIYFKPDSTVVEIV